MRTFDYVFYGRIHIIKYYIIYLDLIRKILICAGIWKIPHINFIKLRKYNNLFVLLYEHKYKTPTCLLTPIQSTCFSKTRTGRDFVNGSAKFSSDATLMTTTSPLSIMSRIKWYFLSMCFCFLWFLGSLDYATAPLLSQ